MADKGLFEQLGIDTRTQEQVLAQNARDTAAAQEATLNARPEAFAGARDLRRAGMMFGRATKEKFGKDPALPPAQQAHIDAIAAGQASFDQKKANGSYLNDDGTPNLVLEGEGFNNAIASELIKIGDPRGFELAKQQDARTRARIADDQALIDADLIRGDNERQRTEDIFDFNQKKFLTARGEVTDFWMQGETDPNNSMTGFMRDNGTIVTREGTEFPMGTYMRQKPVAAKGGEGNSLDIKDYIGTKELSAFRAQHRGLAGQMDMAVALTDAISDSIGEDGTIQMMGTGGKMTAAGVRMVDNVQSIGRTLGGLFIDASDGSSVKMTGSLADADKYARDNQELFTDDMIPENIRGDANATARYQAIIVQFAYGKARMNEPGGRISDPDFRNAVKQIGASSTSPEQLRQILVGDINRTVDNWNIWDQSLPNEIRFKVIKPAGRALFDKAKINFDDRFGNDFGTALNPTEAIVSPQGVPKDHLPAPPPPSTNPVIIQKQGELEELNRQLEEARKNQGG